MIRNNAHKYLVSAICVVLEIPKSTYYFHADLCGKRALKTEDNEIAKEIARIFIVSRNYYGTRKIKKEMSKLPKPKHVSRRRIGPLMKSPGLVSNDTVAQYKPHKSTCNEAQEKILDYKHMDDSIIP